MNMAKHEFGIMQYAPEQGKRYDAYEPQKYSCMTVDDDDLEDIAANFNSIDLYWHTLDVQGKGLAYCGITLIPPSSMPAFIDAIRDSSVLSELRELSERALRENKWMIHYGL